MSQNKYMAVSLTETKADTKKAKSVSQNYKGAVDASVEALNREFGIYKRENEIEMDELRTKIRAAAKSGGGSGEAGKDGVGIKSIEQTVTSTESGGENKIEITLTDDRKEEFTVRNGEKGDPGTAENVTPESIGALKRGTYERIQGTAEAHKNLNDYTLPGFYNVKTAYVDNCPAGIGIDAVLLVYPWDNNIYNMQEITETAASPMCRRWTRHSNAGAWTAWKAVITEDSKSLISAADVGAVRKSGDTIAGTLSFASSSEPNGWASIYKNHNATYDGGSHFSDYNKNSKNVTLKICANQNKVSFYDTDSVEHPIYHTGYKPTPGDIGAMKAHGVINDGSNFDTLADGVYNYNGWATYSDSSVPKPFGNAFGMWIKQSRWGSADNSYRVDIAINCETGDTYTMHNYDGVWHKNTATITPADIGAAPASHAHSKLTGWSDERSKNTTPQDYVDKFAVVGLKNNASIGITGENNSFSGVVGFKPWYDDTGGKSHELAFGGDGGLYHRSGYGETWGNWGKIATTDYIDEQILKGEW